MFSSAAEIPTEELVAELVRRRTRIDDALERSKVWETRQSKILAVCASAWGLSAGRLFSAGRQTKLVYARWMAIAHLRGQSFTFTELAELFGCDASNISHAAKRHRESLDLPDYRRRWEMIQEQLREGNVAVQPPAGMTPEISTSPENENEA